MDKVFYSNIMDEIIKDIDHYSFPAKSDRFIKYANDNTQREGYFHSQLILLFDQLQKEGKIQSWEYEWPWYESGRKTPKYFIDFYLEIKMEKILLEVKAIWLRGIRLENLNKYIWTDVERNGPAKDFMKLNTLPNSFDKWVIAFWYPRPTEEQWTYIERNGSTAWKNKTNFEDHQDQDYGFISLWNYCH